MAYHNIVFLQGDEAAEVLDLLDIEGEEAALEYLRQWDTGEYDGYDENPCGSSDYLYHQGSYIMSYNLSLDYIGLCIKLPE